MPQFWEGSWERVFDLIFSDGSEKNTARLKSEQLYLYPNLVRDQGYFGDDY